MRIVARRCRSFLRAALVVLLFAASVLAVSPPSDAQVAPRVVISEIHYHPQAVGTTFPNFDDRENTEFIELANLEATAVDLSGWCFDQGVVYCFEAGTSLPPSTTIVIVDDAAAFEAVYGFMPAGVYSGKMSNSGEQIRLVDETTAAVVDITWATSDPWPVTPDGNGPSLELQSAAGTIASPANWAASSAIGGSPGSAPSLVSASPPLVTSHDAADLVTANQSIPVSATAVNTRAMTLVYNVDYGTNQTIAMADAGGTWQATLPALSSGGLIQYRFEASGPGGVMTSPRADDAIAWWAVAVASPPASSVPVIDLYFSPQVWTNIENKTCPCAGAVAYEGQIWTDVAVRRAGNTSIDLPKGHMRLDFPDGHPFEASFLDGPVDELSLDAGYPNFDMIREQLSWQMMEQIGFPKIESQHVRVHRSGDFHGLYLLREEQDGNWRSRHDLDRGAFYKVDGAQDSFGFSGQYTKKEGLDESDADLQALAVCVNQSGAVLRDCLSDTTDVPQMINEFASLVVSWQTDQREFNFFLYRDNTQNMLWRMLPDDLDRSWGAHVPSDLGSPDASSGKVYRRCIGTDPTPANEICRAFMNVPEFKEMYLRRIRTLADEVLDDPQWQTSIATLGDYLADEWADDEARWNRTSLSFNQILTALDQWVDAYVAHLQAGGHESNVPGAQSTAPQVSITGYRSDPGDGLGYVLITNPSSTESVDLSNWQFDGLAEISPGLVVLPGSTVAVSTNDQQFRAANPGFTGVRAETQGTLAGQVSLLRRDGSTAATIGELPTSPLVLNEWNAVSSANTLANGDLTLGTIPGNGGDWFELAVISNGLDVRGWRLVMSDNDGPTQQVTDEFEFANDPLLANLEGGTIITVSESFVDDVIFLPALDDWHINLQANSADEGNYFTPSSQSNFDTNHQNWQLSIFDAAGTLVFGPAGEGIGATSGINSSEIGELQVDPSSSVNPLVDFGDGDGSTFGLANFDASIEQNFSALRYPYVGLDVNCNGSVNVADALRVAEYSVGNLTASSTCPLADPLNQIYVGAADSNNNGTVNVADALLIAQCSVGLFNAACPG